jgi:hypothetical protein
MTSGTCSPELSLRWGQFPACLVGGCHDFLLAVDATDALSFRAGSHEALRLLHDSAHERGRSCVYGGVQPTADDNKKGIKMLKKNVAKGIASLAAVAAIAAGGFAVSSNGGSNSASAAGNATTSTTTAAAPNGTPPAGARMGGTPATGTEATKAKAAALAKYPGTAERVMKFANGGYGVHVIKSDGTQVHVLVSSTFTVTGTQTGGPPAGMKGQAPPGVAPQGSPSSPSSSGTSTS